VSASFEIQAFADELAALATRPHLHKIVVVLPLAPGMREVAWDFLAEGPPYDLAKAGIDRHEVFLTDDEAIFVFSTPRGPATLEHILSEEDFWAVVRAWEHIAAGPPRLAQVAYDWPRA
jgi:hypothetical protein